MILIDLQMKAFDTLDHKLLLSKLSLMNFRNETNNWFKFYLFDRTVLINAKSSFLDPADLKCGAWQGAILCLFVFLNSPRL